MAAMRSIVGSSRLLMDPFNDAFAMGFEHTAPDYTPLDFGPLSRRNDHSATPARKDSGFGSHSPTMDSKEDARRHKRKEQNRTAQRAYRERKVQRIVELEVEIERLEETNATLESDNQQLESAVHRLKTENEVIRSVLSSTQQSSPNSVVGSTGPSDLEGRKAILLKDCLTVYGGWYDGAAAQSTVPD